MGSFAGRSVGGVGSEGAGEPGMRRRIGRGAIMLMMDDVELWRERGQVGVWRLAAENGHGGDLGLWNRSEMQGRG